MKTKKKKYVLLDVSKIKAQKRFLEKLKSTDGIVIYIVHNN